MLAYSSWTVRRRPTIKGLSSMRTLDSPYVPALLHSRNHKWLVVAEAPGEQEEKQGLPLIGPTGKLFDGFLGSINLKRTDVDITNVLHYRPPANRLDDWLEEKHPAIEEGIEELKQLLEEHRYEAILAMGWFSLFVLTGKRGITEHRGSIYPCSLGERDVPVLGTFHPAKLFRDPKDANIIFRDFAKFRRIILQGAPKPLDRDLTLFPSRGTVEQWFARARQKPYVAVDIEANPNTRELTEVGIAWDATHAITVNKDSESWDLVKDFLATDIPKVFHNAMFDWPFLEYVLGWKVGGEVQDTMMMHHTLYPELPKDLGFCASIYTDEPYWKDLGGDKDIALRQRYNALDVAATAEMYPILLSKLRSSGLMDTYERDRRMLPVAKRMSLRGVRYDTQEATKFTQRLYRNWKRYQYLVNRYSGMAKEEADKIWQEWEKRSRSKNLNSCGLNVGSHPQVSSLLYQKIGLPQQRRKDKKTGEQKATTSQLKLLSLYPHITERRARRVVRALLYARQARKMLSSYLKTKLGKDGRVRTSFGVSATETGRWNASAFLIGLEGTNLQTVPPSWKSCFIADEGKLLFYADYSQIEARLVGYDAEDEVQIAVFEDPQGDIHKENAARILGKAKEAVTDRERTVVGKTVHALNYNVGPGTLAESINKRGLETGVWVTEAFTRGIREKYLGLYKNVTAWQQRQWNQVCKTKTLTNHLGRRRIFLGPTKGQFAEVTRGEAIAFVPQSDVPDMLNIAMERLDNTPWVELLLQVHDAVLGQIPEQDVVNNCKRICELMTVPLLIHGRQCIVPVDIKVGKRWSELQKVEKYVAKAAGN